jgi:AraC-like DNA-binding protein
LDTISRGRTRYATAKTRNVAAIPEVLREFGARVPAILRQAGLDPGLFDDLEGVMPYVSLGRLLTVCVKATGCESFGLRVGVKTRLSALGLTSLVSINSPTVRDALKVIIDTLKTSDTGGAAFLDVRDGLASFGYAVIAPNIESVDQIEDGALVIGLNILRRLCGPTWRPERVELSRASPCDEAPFIKVFRAPVEFGAPRTRLIFDPSTLAAPVRDRDPDTAAILAPLLEAAAADAPGDFVASVRLIIRSQIGAGALTRSSVCRALGLSARTFAHRLEAHSVTYSGLADEAKFDSAQSLLFKKRPIAEIAATLGFTEPSAFTRAFKKWSGTTPARWRAARSGR